MLVGLGRTGEEVLRQILERWLLYQPADESPRSQAVLLSGDLPDPEIRPELMMSLKIDASENRVQTFVTNRQQVEVAVVNKRQSWGNEMGQRHFVIGSLSEPEIGLLHPVLQGLHDPQGGQAALPELFLTVRSPVERLAYPERFAAVREIIQYLHEGVRAGSPRLLQHVYIFDGSRELQDFSRITVPSIAESILTFMSGGTSLSGVENSTLNHSDGTPPIRMLKIRAAVKPVMELSAYFAWKYLKDSWNHGQTLLPAVPLTQDHVSLIHETPYEYQRYLESWIGKPAASWLFNSAQRQPPTIEEQRAVGGLLTGAANLLADEKNPDRFSILYAVLKSVNAGSKYPLLCKAGIRCWNGLRHLFEGISEYEKYLDEKIRTSGEKILDRTLAPIARWTTVRAVLAEADQRYLDLMGMVEDQLFTSIERTMELEYQISGDKITWNLITPFQVNELRSNYDAYLAGIHERIQTSLFDRLARIEAGWDDLNNKTLDFLNGAWTAPTGHPQEVRKHDFLLGPPNVDRTLLSQQYHAIRYIPRSNKNVLTGFTVFTGLYMPKTGDIPKYAELYSPQETSHIEGPVKHTAHFESLLPSKSKAAGLFCEELIDTLRRREIPTAFFEAYFAGLLTWKSSKKSWVLAEFPRHKEIQLFEDQAVSLIPPTIIRKENLESLWEAYHRFAVEIPATLAPGAIQFDLHPVNQSKYLDDLIAYARKKDRKGACSDWLDEQGNKYRENRLLYDFYRLGQAVQATTRK